MITIYLQTTISNIAKSNQSNFNPLDIFRIINLPSPRNWYFRIEFNSENHNILHMKCNPPLSESELRDCLDGRIPLLFGYKSVFCKLGEKCYGLNLKGRSLQNERGISFEFLDSSDENIDGQIKIVGISLSPIVQRQDDFRNWLEKFTWLGSEIYSGQNYELVVIMYANKYIINNVKKRTDDILPFYLERMPIISGTECIGELILRLRISSVKNRCRHSKYGCIRVDLVEQQFWKVLDINKYGGTDIEINEPYLHWYTYYASYDYEKMKSLFSSILKMKDKIKQSSNYISFLNKAEIVRRENMARAILGRQTKLEQSKRVFVDRTEYMSLPSCENELVALYMKLEATNKLPFQCTVLEYTSKIGIDALANFRIKNTDAMLRHAPVEFEYMLENYFEHAHPIEQTQLIICWDKDDEIDSYEYDNRDMKLRKENDWLYYCVHPNKCMPVVVLSRIPKLKIK